MNVIFLTKPDIKNRRHGFDIDKFKFKSPVDCYDYSYRIFNLLSVSYASNRCRCENVFRSRDSENRNPFIRSIGKRFILWFERQYGTFAFANVPYCKYQYNLYKSFPDATTILLKYQSAVLYRHDLRFSTLSQILPAFHQKKPSGQLISTDRPARIYTTSRYNIHTTRRL